MATPITRAAAIFPLVLLVFLGCSRTSSDIKLTSGRLPVGTPAAVASNEVKHVPALEGHGSRKLKRLDIPVYIDGVQVSVLRYGDMPGIPNVGDETVPAFRLSDYLVALGISPQKVRAVQVMSGFNTVGQIAGSELVAGKERFRVQFASGVTGVPEARWDMVGLKDTYMVHEIRKMAVYVSKSPPALDKARQCYVNGYNDCEATPPYVDGDPAKGTRVYLDGRMVGFVKRRYVGSDLVVGKKADGDLEFSFSGLVRLLGVDPTTVKGLELIAGDDVVGRAKAREWQTAEADIAFTLPAHQHGKISVQIPSNMQEPVPSGSQGASGPRDALVSAVKLYRTTSPSERPLVAISEDTDQSVRVALRTEREEERATAREAALTAHQE